MQYNGLKIGVFFKNKKWVEQWFTDFINKIDHACILKFVKNGTHPFMIELKDGTVIIAYQIPNNIRGICIDKAFVESTIDNETIRTMIKPLIKYTCEIDY